MRTIEEEEQGEQTGQCDGNRCAVTTPRRTVNSVPKTKASAAGISI